MTDIEKFKRLLEELNIVYEIEDPKNGLLIIEIDDCHIGYGHGKSLYIIFNDDGSFKEFEPWGE